MLAYRFAAAAQVIWRKEPYFTEFMSGATALAWCVFSYISPTDMSDWPSMALLTRIGSDDFWVVVSGLLGVAQVGVVLADRRWLRWAAAGAMCWFWGVLTLGVWLAVPWAPGVTVYGAFVVSNVFSILRLLRP